MTSSTQTTSVSKKIPPADLARTWLYGLAILCYLILKVGHVGAIAPAMSALSLVSIVVSLPVSGWATRILGTLFLGGGTWMMCGKGVDAATYLSAYGEMLSLLALFAVVPVLSTPVKLGGYGRAIQDVLRGRISGVFQLNCLVTTLSFICGSFMSMASVPIMMTSMEPVVGTYPIKNPTRFMAVSSAFGYVLPILWTPVSGVVGVILYTLHMEWMSIFPLLFLLSVAGLVVSWGIFYMLEIRGNPGAAAPREEPAPSGAPSPLPRLLQMIAAIVLLVVCLSVTEHFLQIGLITVVALVSPIFALAWSAAIGQGRPFAREASQQFAIRLPRMADQVAIFLSAGFFAKAMHLSGFDHPANLMFLHLHDLLGTHLFLVLMPVMTLIGSFLGVHPLVAIALLSDSLKPDVLGITTMQLAVTLIGSSTLTYMLGPFSGTLGLVQSLTRVSTFRLSAWNAPYAIGYSVLLVATIALL